MRENYHYRFKYFDPKEGHLPDPYAVMFVEVNYRARKMLAEFTKEQIAESTLAINKLVKDKNFIDPLVEDLKNEPIPTPMFGTVFEIIPTSNDLDGIYQNIGNVSLNDYINFPKFDWPHLFASIALYYSEIITQGLNDLENWAPDKIFPDIPKPTDERLKIRANEYLAEAKQAITFAQTLINQTALNKQYHSEKNRKAIKIRYAKTSNILRDAVLHLYIEKHQKKSNRNAALMIYNELIDSGRLAENSRLHAVSFDGRPALNTDDPMHQFEKWIGQMKRNG